jgi:hypothetical protein
MRQPSDIILELGPKKIRHNKNTPLRLDEDSEESVPTMLPLASGAGVIIGILAGFSESCAPLVDFPDNKASHALVARTTTGLSVTQIGSEVILTFERCDLTKPIILGCLHPHPLLQRERSADVELDGERLTFSAEREIVLRCGEASITLTRAGKILIRGSYLLSRSSGVNRIKGGSVQIN